MSGPGGPGAPPPTPEALAVANFLKSQPLKSRTCILQGQRKELFKVKRALRALQSPAYENARKKNPLLPPVTNQLSAAQTFSLLPRSLLALRVSKIPDEGKTKHIKGLWTVKVEPQQEIREDLYYAFFYEPRSWVQMLTAVGVVAGILTVVLFPLWPPIMRLGVWYLSMGCLGLVGLFILMSIFRLILFVITMFVASPGLWLYPNLFEDVGFFDSFRPVWAWHKVKKAKGKKAAVPAPPSSTEVIKSAPATQTSQSAAPGTSPNPANSLVSRKPTVEEADE